MKMTMVVPVWNDGMRWGKVRPSPPSIVMGLTPGAVSKASPAGKLDVVVHGLGEAHGVPYRLAHTGVCTRSYRCKSS
jgi:hypothetical protein